MTDNGGREPQMVHLRQRQSSRGLFSPEVVDLVLPPLKFGGYSGMLLWCVLAQPNWRQVGTAGVLAGVGGSIFKEANPIIWGAVSGFQWFTLGTSFWCKLILWHDLQHSFDCKKLTHFQVTRGIVLKAWGGEERLRNSEKTMASAISGTAAGAVGGLIRKSRLSNHCFIADTITRRT